MFAYTTKHHLSKMTEAEEKSLHLMDKAFEILGKEGVEEIAGGLGVYKKYPTRFKVNTCKVCLATDGRAGHLIEGMCWNCADSTVAGTPTFHETLERTDEEIRRTIVHAIGYDPWTLHNSRTVKRKAYDRVYKPKARPKEKFVYTPYLSPVNIIEKIEEAGFKQIPTQKRNVINGGARFYIFLDPHTETKYWTSTNGRVYSATDRNPDARVMNRYIATGAKVTDQGATTKIVSNGIEQMITREYEREMIYLHNDELRLLRILEIATALKKKRTRETSKKFNI
jgi:hypothetical protein